MLRRPKSAAYVDERTILEFLERIQRHATVVDDPSSKYDYLVAVARSEHVDAIVSGDRDLVDARLAYPAVWSERDMADRLLDARADGAPQADAS